MTIQIFDSLYNTSLIEKIGKKKLDCGCYAMTFRFAGKSEDEVVFHCEEEDGIDFMLTDIAEALDEGESFLELI